MICFKKALFTALLAAPLAFTTLHAEDYILKAKDAEGQGKIKMEGSRNWGYWKGEGSGATWTLNVKTPGTVTVKAYLAIPGKALGGTAQLMLDGEEVAELETIVTKAWQKYKPHNFGEIKLPAGKHTISVLSKETRGQYFANMKGVKIETDDAELEVIPAN